MYRPEDIMADDLEMLRMLRSMFTGSAPTNKQDKAMTDEFMKDERYPTSPAYQYIEPTEKPLERVEAPWEMLLPTMRALKAIQLLKTGRAVKKMAGPASDKLMQTIKPAVKQTTGYKDNTVGAVLRDLNRNNPLSKRLFKEIKDVDLQNPSPAEKERIMELMKMLGYRGKKAPRVLTEEGIDPWGHIDASDFSLFD